MSPHYRQATSQHARSRKDAAALRGDDTPKKAVGRPKDAPSTIVNCGKLSVPQGDRRRLGMQERAGVAGSWEGVWKRSRGLKTS
jgi:hypothetical protein